MVCRLEQSGSKYDAERNAMCGEALEVPSFFHTQLLAKVEEAEAF